MSLRRHPHGLSPDASRALANRRNKTTALGLRAAHLGGAEVTRGPDELLFASGYRLSFPVAGAFTLGNVVLSRHQVQDLPSDVLDHEARHADQYARLGLAMLPLYVAATAWSWVAYGDMASGNVFERHAGLQAGGYLDPEQSPRPRALWRRVARPLRRRA